MLVILDLCRVIKTNCHSLFLTWFLRLVFDTFQQLLHRYKWDGNWNLRITTVKSWAKITRDSRDPFVLLLRFHFFIYICTVLWLDIFYGEAVFNNCVCHGKRANKAERVQKKRWESNFNPWWNAKLLLPCIIDRLESLFSIRWLVYNACDNWKWNISDRCCFRPSYPSASQLRFIEYKCTFHWSLCNTYAISHIADYHTSIFNLIFCSIIL